MSIKYQGGFLISKIKNVSGRIFSRMLRQFEVEINPAQGRIMFALWQNDGIPIQELAKRTSLGKSTLTSMLDRLEQLGYVIRERSKADRRTILIRRTAKDRALQETYERVSNEMSNVYYNGFSEREIETFESTLERILKNLTDADVVSQGHSHNRKKGTADE
ncbi:MarR family winged helix-turn-helix transcriptional regulator [Candidatus Bipolaricaulota bacterium]